MLNYIIQRGVEDHLLGNKELEQLINTFDDRRVIIKDGNEKAVKMTFT
jgi:hypothetical protein